LRVGFGRNAKCAEEDVKLARRELDSMRALRATMHGPGALLGVTLAEPCGSALRQLVRAAVAQERNPFGHLEQDTKQQVGSDSV